MSKSAISLQKNILWNTVGNFFYLFTQWLLTYITVKLLGFSDAGILSLATSISGSLIGIGNYGMRSFQVSDVAEKYSDGAYIFSRYFTSSLALVVCIVFLIIKSYSFYIGLCILIYMGFKISEAVSDVYQGILQKRMRMDYIGISFILKGILTLGTFILASILSNSLLIGIVAMTVTSFLVVFIYDRRKAKEFLSQNWDLGKKRILSLLVECLPVALFSILFTTFSLAPRYFLEAQMGTEALGFYSSVALPAVIVQVSASYIFAPLTTPFAEYLNEGKIDEFKRLFFKIVLIIAALSGVALLGFYFLGDWFLTLLFGSDIDPYTYLLMPLVVCTILTAVAWFLATILTILRRLAALLSASAISFVIVLVGGAPTILWFGMNGFGMNGATYILIFALTINIIASLAILFFQERKTPKKQIPMNKDML